MSLTFMLKGDPFDNYSLRECCDFDTCEFCGGAGWERVEEPRWGMVNMSSRSWRDLADTLGIVLTQEQVEFGSITGPDVREWLGACLAYLAIGSRLSAQPPASGAPFAVIRLAPIKQERTRKQRAENLAKLLATSLAHGRPVVWG